MKKVLLLIKKVFLQCFVMLNGEMSSSFTRMKFYLQMHDSFKITSSVLRESFIRSCTTPVYFDDMRRWKLLKLIQCQAQMWMLQENKFMLYVSQVPGRVSTSQEDDWYWSFNEWNSSYFQRHGEFIHVYVTMIQSSYNEDAIQLMLMMVRALRPPAHHPSLCFITSQWSYIIQWLNLHQGVMMDTCSI